MNFSTWTYARSRSPLWLSLCLALGLALIVVAYVATNLGLEDRKRELESTLKEQSWRTLQVLSAGALEPVISEDFEHLNTLVMDSVRLDPDLYLITILDEFNQELFSWTNTDGRKDTEIYTYETDITIETEKFGKIVASWDPTRLLEEISTELVQERKRLITALLALTGLSLLLLHVLVVAPLHRMRHRMESLSHSANFEPLEINSSRELSMLANAVNELDTSITESRNLSIELEYRAKHDVVTGLSNRYAFETHLKDHLKNRKADQTESTLLYIDLDQFKLVNDTCGHSAGDELLLQLATLFRNQLGHDHQLARLGGDEFTVLLIDTPLKEALEVAERIRTAAHAHRFSWEGRAFAVETSIGAVPINRQGDNFERVLSAADQACYSAKNQGRNRVHCYLEDDNEQRERVKQGCWIPRILDAIERSRLILYGQPIEPTNGTQTLGEHIEILVRMLDDNNEVIPPGAFLPAAERYGLMPQIDRYVVTHTIDWLATQAAVSTQLPVLAINISGHSICDPDFRKFVFDSLIENEQLCNFLSFEITETTAVANLAAAVEFMSEVKRFGCTFALDDFGAGMSSFTYLKNLPVDYVKIDGSFVKNILTDRTSLAMVRAISEIVCVMQIQSIAEYVENQEIRDKLLEIGIDHVQGFGVAKPVSLTTFDAEKVGTASGSSGDSAPI